MPVPKRLQYILGYIEDNLDAPLTLDALAKEAVLSKYHFARLFRAYFGLPPLDVVKRYRIKRAGNQLAFRDLLSVTDIALQASYQNTESFSRAFQQLMGCSPTDFRQQANIDSLNQLLAPLTDRKKAMVNTAMFNVEIVNFDAVTTAQFVHRGPSTQIGTSIQQFIAWRKENKLPPSKSRTFNLLFDDPTQTPPSEFRFGLACEITEPLTDKDKGLIQESSIPKGRYAKVRHVGSDSVLETIVNFLYGTWLPDSKECLGEFPIFFERISFYPDVAENEAITDVYLPLT